MARVLAAKAALCIRVDALSDADTKSDVDAATIGLENRAKLETRLRVLEQGLGHTSLRSIAKASGGTNGQQKKFEMQGNGASYNTAADTLLLPTAAAGVKADEMDEDEPVVENGVHATAEMDEAARKAAKKAAKKAKKLAEAQQEGAAAAQAVTVPPTGSDEDDEAARKEAKRLKKEAKKARKESIGAADDAPVAAASAVADVKSSSSSKKDKKKDKKRKLDDDAEEVGAGSSSKKVKAKKA